MVEDHLTAAVGFVEEIEILQDRRIVEDSLHNVMATDPRYLTHQEESELMCRVNLSTSRLPLSLVLLLLQSFRFLCLGLQLVNVRSL